MSPWHLLWIIPTAWLLVCCVWLRALDWTVRGIWRDSPALTRPTPPGLVDAIRHVARAGCRIRLAPRLCNALNANAVAIGRTILVASPGMVTVRRLGVELVHCLQWTEARFPVRFIACYLIGHLRHGYADNPMEEAAHPELEGPGRKPRRADGHAGTEL